MKTKTIQTLLIAAFITLTGSVQAQKISYGVLGGIDLMSNQVTNSAIRSIPAPDINPSLSFNANAFVEYKSSGIWGVSVEPGFIRKGGYDEVGTAEYNTDVSLILNYLNMPLLLNVYLGDKFYLSCGPELAVLLKGQSKISGSRFDIGQLYSRKLEASAQVGLNYSLTEHFDLGLRYNHDLTYTSKWIDYPTDEQSKEYNQYLQFIVKFRL